MNTAHSLAPSDDHDLELADVDEALAHVAITLRQARWLDKTALLEFADDLLDHRLALRG